MGSEDEIKMRWDSGENDSVIPFHPLQNKSGVKCVCWCYLETHWCITKYKDTSVRKYGKINPNIFSSLIQTRGLLLL